MPERHTHIAEHGRVCQVTLQTGNRQFHRQVLKNSIRHAQVSFRIFKVNRVHLVRHRAGAHLTGFNLLLEVFHRDILPEVTVHINHHRIDALHGIKDGRQIIVIGYLGSILLAFQAKLFGNELIAECLPVIFRISHMMGIVITRSATELCCHRTSLQRCQLAFQTVDKHHYLLAQTGRRSRLSVCLGKHGDSGPLFRISTELRYQFLYLRIVHLLQRLLYRQRNRRIVDIL